MALLESLPISIGHIRPGRLQSSQLFRDFPGREAIVGIKVLDVIAAGRRRAHVSRSTRSGVILHENMTDSAVPPRNGDAIVSRSIVDHDNLEIVDALVVHALQRGSEPSPAVIARDNNGYQGRRQT